MWSARSPTSSPSSPGSASWPRVRRRARPPWVPPFPHRRTGRCRRRRRRSLHHRPRRDPGLPSAQGVANPLRRGGGWTRVPFLPFPPPTLPLARITPTFSSLAHPAPPRRPPLFVAPGFRPLTRAPAPFSAPAVVAASPLAAGAAAGVEGPPTKRRRVPADAPVPEAGVPAFRWHEAAGPEVGVAVRVPRSPPPT